MAGLALAVALNVVGLNVGKWLSNVGAHRRLDSGALLIALGVVSWARFGSATPITVSALVPSTGLKDVIFWSTIAFAFGGVESASTMGEEIVDARRTVPRAVLAAGVVITVLYIARHAVRAAGAAQGTDLGAAGHHAGDAGDGGEGRASRGWCRWWRRS